MSKFLKVLILILSFIILGFSGYYFLFSGKNVNDSEADIRSKRFYLMIENYTTPVADISVSTMKRSNSFFGKIVSTRCRIAEFINEGKKQGYIRDTVKIDKLPILFVSHKIPDGRKWAEYLSLIAGTKKELVIHGLLINANGKIYFVPQRLFSPDNKNIDVLLAEARTQANKTNKKN